MRIEAHLLVPITDYGLRITDYGLLITDGGFNR